MSTSPAAPPQLSLYRYRRTNKNYTEDLGNGVKLTLMLIPAGEFWMGAPEDEPGSEDYERPRHLVKVSPFLMGRFPVTQAQWRVVAGYDRVARDLDPDPSSFKGDNRPVERVSWEDAQEFYLRLSVKTGKDYRLPSEAEWEYACRAGTTTPFHFGETIAPELANYYSEESYNGGPTSESRGQTTDVGSFPANDWGLCDMHGNVREWCEDDYYDNYRGAPTDGSAWVDAINKVSSIESRANASKLLRGGSWLNFPQGCRSADRGHDSRDGRDDDFGFRVCCVPPSA